MTGSSLQNALFLNNNQRVVTTTVPYVNNAIPQEGRIYTRQAHTHTHLPTTLLVPMGSNALSSHMALCYCSGEGGHTVEGLTASSLVSRSKNPCYPANMIPGRQAGARKAFLGLEA